MNKRQDNTQRITAAQRKVCYKLLDQTTRLVSTMEEAEVLGVPSDDCRVMIQHLLCGCQQPLPQDRHPAVTTVLEGVQGAMSALGAAHTDLGAPRRLQEVTEPCTTLEWTAEQSVCEILKEASAQPTPSTMQEIVRYSINGFPSLQGAMRAQTAESEAVMSGRPGCDG